MPKTEMSVPRHILSRHSSNCPHSVSTDLRLPPHHLIPDCKRGASAGILTSRLQYKQGVWAMSSVSVGWRTNSDQVKTGYCTTDATADSKRPDLSASYHLQVYPNSYDDGVTSNRYKSLRRRLFYWETNGPTLTRRSRCPHAQYRIFADNICSGMTKQKRGKNPGRGNPDHAKDDARHEIRSPLSCSPTMCRHVKLRLLKGHFFSPSRR